MLWTNPEDETTVDRECKHCHEQFETLDRFSDVCDDCESIEANDDVFDVYYGDSVIAKATLLDAVRFAHETNQTLEPFDDHVFSIGDLEFHRQHPDGFERLAEWFRDIDSLPYCPGLTLEMIGIRYESGHNYLPRMVAIEDVQVTTETLSGLSGQEVNDV